MKNPTRPGFGLSVRAIWLPGSRCFFSFPAAVSRRRVFAGCCRQGARRAKLAPSLRYAQLMINHKRSWFLQVLGESDCRQTRME